VVIIAKPYAIKFYKSKQWKQTREYILRRDNYLCVMCGEVAEEIHHVIHLKPDNIDDVSISLGEGNLQSLCRTCHFNQHRVDRGIVHIEEEYKFDEQGYIIKDNSSIIKDTVI